MSNARAPAYPSPLQMNNGESFFYPGLTKREEFAKAAMQAILSRGAPHDVALVNKSAIFYADDLLAQLEKTNV